MTDPIVIRTACGDGVHLFRRSDGDPEDEPCVCGQMDIFYARAHGIQLHPSTFAPESEEVE